MKFGKIVLTHSDGKFTVILLNNQKNAAVFLSAVNNSVKIRTDCVGGWPETP